MRQLCHGMEDWQKDAYFSATGQGAVYADIYRKQKEWDMTARIYGNIMTEIQPDGSVRGQTSKGY